MTQEQVAERLDVSFQAVSAWERDEYRPDTDNLIRLAEVLDTSVSSIVEEKRGTFRTKDVIYDWEHMKTFVKATAKGLGLTDTLRALDYAVEAHHGQTRKRSKTPYIYHPLNMACHALSMGIKEDAVIAAILLHDVIEDCGKTAEDLPVGEPARRLVVLMTHEKANGQDREQVMDAYYAALEAEPAAALIKCIDRCNNLTTMAWGLSRERIYRMIAETEKYYPQLLRRIKEEPAYNDAAWLLRYQIESMLDIYKRLL